MGQPFSKKEMGLKNVAHLNGSPVMQGELKTISLADVLQLLGNRSGRHLIKISLSHGIGKIYLEGPALYHVEIVGDEEKEGFEAFVGLLQLKEGRFEVYKPVVWPEKGNLKGPVQALLIEAVRRQDEATEETFLNEDLFDQALELNPPEAPEPEPSSFWTKVRETLPEIRLGAVVDPEGEVKESHGEGEVEELSGFVSYACFQLREIGELLGMGELKAFAISGKRKLYAALVAEEKILGLAGVPRKGLLWWSKKLLELEKGTET